MMAQVATKVREDGSGDQHSTAEHYNTASAALSFFLLQVQAGKLVSSIQYHLFEKFISCRPKIEM